MWKEGTARKLFISECGTVSRQLGATFQRTFKSIGLIWRHRQSWFSFHTSHHVPSHKASPYATPLKPQSSQTPKDYKIHLSSHLYIRIYYYSTLQQNLGAITNLYDPHLRTTSNVNLSHQHSQLTSKYCSSVIIPSGLELSCCGI